MLNIRFPGNFFAWNDRPAAAGNKINVANCISALTLVSQVCPLVRLNESSSARLIPICSDSRDRAAVACSRVQTLFSP